MSFYSLILHFPLIKFNIIIINSTQRINITKLSNDYFLLEEEVIHQTLTFLRLLINVYFVISLLSMLLDKHLYVFSY